MTSNGLGEMLEGDFADMCARKFPLVSMGGLACTDPGARTPIGASGIIGRFKSFLHFIKLFLIFGQFCFKSDILDLDQNSQAKQNYNLLRVIGLRRLTI